MATTRNTPILKWLAITAGTLWIVGAGWLQLFPADRHAYQRPSQGTSTFAEKCRGSNSKRDFSKRYDCVSKLMLEYGRTAFASGVKKTLIVALPPLLLLMLFRVAVTNRNRREGEEIARRKSTKKARLISAKAEMRTRELVDQKRKDQIDREARLRALEDGRRQYHEVKSRIDGGDDDGWYADADDNLCKVITKSISSDDGGTLTISALIRLNPDGNKQLIRL